MILAFIGTAGSGKTTLTGSLENTSPKTGIG